MRGPPDYCAVITASSTFPSALSMMVLVKRPSPRAPDPAVATRSLAEIGRILQQGLAGRPVKILLFGSWARAEATQQSDIDVALLSDEPLPSALLPELRERLEESHVPYRVDLVDLASCDRAFRDRVLREAVPWTA